MPHPPIGKRLLQMPSQDRGNQPGARAPWPGLAKEPRHLGGNWGGPMAPRDAREREADWRGLQLAMLEQAAGAPWGQAPALRAELEEELHRVILDLLNETTRIARLLDGD